MKVFRKNGYYSPPCIEPQPRSRLLDTVRRRVEMRAARESRFAAKFLHISVLPSSISPARPTPLCGVGRLGGNHKNSIFIITNNHSCVSCPISPLLYGLRTVCSHALSKPPHPARPEFSDPGLIPYDLHSSPFHCADRSFILISMSAQPVSRFSVHPLCKSLYID